MPNKNLKTSVSVLVWQVIAPALLLYLLPLPGSVDKFLLSVIKDQQCVSTVKILLLILVILMPFYLHLKDNRPLSMSNLKDLLLEIQKNVESEYEIHRNNVLDKNFRKIVDEESSRGFTKPSGSLNERIIDLYKEEFSIFSKILENSIAVADINLNSLHPHLSLIVVEMFNKNRDKIKNDYKKVADGYWGGIMDDFDLNKNFAKIAEHETKLQINKFLSAGKINEIIT